MTRLWAVRYGVDSTLAPGYTPPANTSDKRSIDCQYHHVGCDCREAMVQEDIAELIAERDEWKALAEVLLTNTSVDLLVVALRRHLRRDIAERRMAEVPF